LYFPEEHSKQFEKDEIIVLDQPKAPEWHEAKFHAKIDIF
jgi:hypothetical protein